METDTKKFIEDILEELDSAIQTDDEEARETILTKLKGFIEGGLSMYELGRQNPTKKKDLGPQC